MTSAEYWRLKAVYLETELISERARARLARALVAAGLDPSAAYALDDEAEAVRLAPAPAEGVKGVGEREPS